MIAVAYGWLYEREDEEGRRFLESLFSAPSAEIELPAESKGAAMAALYRHVT